MAEPLGFSLSSALVSALWQARYSESVVITIKKPVTAENYPVLYLALEERDLLYQGDRSGGFIEGWEAHAEKTKDRVVEPE
jgi:hypothetical protein